MQISNLSLSNSYESVPIDFSSDLIDSIYNIAQVVVTKKNGTVLSSKAGVRHVQATAVLPGIIQTGSSLEGVILKGIDQNFDTSFFKKFLKVGQPLVAGNEGLDKAVISEQTASRMDIKIGDDLRLLFVINGQQFPRKFEVTGIYRTGLEEYDRKFVLVDIQEIRQLLKWRDDQVGELEIFVERVEDAPVIADYIYFEMLEDELYCESIKDKYPGIFEWLELQNVNEIVILGLMLLVCILNMITTLLILILEKTNMIGILKALGARDWTIRKMFLNHGLFILLRGLIVGNILGIGICLIQKWTSFLKLNEADYYLSSVPISIDWWFILLINSVTIVIVLIFLLLPTILISKISPIKVIRFN